jgi:glyoxylase-like metal-dependent hydrolase (beta-lactamase superfamily II)
VAGAKRRSGRVLRTIAVVLAVLAAGLFLAKALLLDRAAVPERSGYGLDLQRVRALAAEPEGPLPLRVNGLRIATAEFPRAAVIAGAPFEPHTMLRSAFQVVYASGQTIIIDTAYDRSLHDQRSQGQPFDDEHYELLQQAMRQADTIVVTHEHPDHLGGLARSPHLPELLGKALLSVEQLSDPERLERAGFAQDALAAYEPLRYRGLHALAPGVVLIKAPGHTPGSQMVYVQLASGAQFLFVGDIAWNMANIEKLTGRPLLVARFLLREDRAAVHAQLRALHDLLQQEPELHLVVAHDGEQLDEHMAADRIGVSFE